MGRRYFIKGSLAATVLASLGFPDVEYITLPEVVIDELDLLVILSFYGNFDVELTTPLILALSACAKEITRETQFDLKIALADSMSNIDLDTHFLGSTPESKEIFLHIQGNCNDFLATCAS